ncbi:MAG: class I SAM-dependent methyltransferase [Candidatus Micrarchaeaceae archaeon]
MKIKEAIGRVLQRNSSQSKPSAYQINYGFGPEYYTERLVELPFLWRNISRTAKNVLDIGCWESLNGIQLAMQGYIVDGIDIQEYGFKHNNFTFIHDDFIEHDFGSKRYDAIINISAIEHFGLPVYTNTKIDFEADIKAIRKVYDLLVKGGQFIFTAPVGTGEIFNNFERCYKPGALKGMLRDMFKINTEEYYLIETNNINRISEEEAEIRHKPHKYAVVCLDLVKT